MKLRGVIITGTSGSGKSALVKDLCILDSRFSQVKAVTTRAARTDDETGAYDYLSEEQFHELVENNELLVEANYREQCYGIRHSAVREVEDRGEIPILVIMPEAAEHLDGLKHNGERLTELPRYLSVFVDAPDDILDERLGIRDAADSIESVLQQREKDREHHHALLHTIKNLDLRASVEMVVSLWDYHNVGGVLSARLIHLMIECGILLEKASRENVSGASYDLSLGDEFFYGGRIRRLTDDEPILLIEPYDYAIVTSHEVSNLPNDVCGRFDLSVSLFAQGVILSNGPQIDPGFRGPLFCLLFNTSSSPVLLKRRQHYATLEFHKLVEPTFSYGGQYQAKDLLHYLPSNAARGAINELKKELDQVQSESRNLQGIVYATLTLIVAILAVYVSTQ